MITDSYKSHQFVRDHARVKTTGNTKRYLQGEIIVDIVVHFRVLIFEHTNYVEYYSY